MTGRASQIIDGKKQCGKCKEWFPVEDFFVNHKATTGLSSACKPCTRERKRISVAANPPTDEQRREYKRRYQERFPERITAGYRKQLLKGRYGVTLEWYEAKLAEQAGVCAICKQPETAINPRTGLTKPLAVDHCHTTGDNRGLLCGKCNTGIGLFLDSPQLLRDAADYVEKSRGIT
jgi:hypothetical protein